MNKNYLELTNLIGDLDRSVIFYADNSNLPQASNCIFLQNIIENYSKLVKYDQKIAEFIDINYLQNDFDPPKIKAENMLMSSIRLQNYLFFK